MVSLFQYKEFFFGKIFAIETDMKHLFNNN